MAIGISTPKRVASLPMVATYIEQGVAGFDVSSWVGILVPIMTPRALVERLQKEIAIAQKDPDLAGKYETLGIEPVGNTPEQVTEQIKADLARWKVVVEAAKIRLE